MASEKFNFVVNRNQEKRKVAYQLLLEKAKAIYFSSQKRHPSVLIKRLKSPDVQIYDLVTKISFHNEGLSFCASNLSRAGVADWLKHLIKFFFDNKNEKFQIDLIVVFFGKFCFPETPSALLNSLETPPNLRVPPNLGSHQTRETQL